MNQTEIQIITNNITNQLAGNYVAPLVIMGLPGIGKTSVVKSIASSMNCKIVNCSAATLTLETLTGIPTFVTAPSMDEYYSNELITTSEATQWSVPEMVQVANTLSKSSGVIILLDDLHEMPRATQSALYELLLERKLGQYELASNIAIIATGNNSQEANYNGFPSPVVNRLAFLNVSFSFDFWYNSVGINYHMYVSSFLKAHPHTIQESENTESPYGTPRSYEFLSNTIISLDKDFVSDNIKRLAEMYISKESAIALAKHVAYIERINFANIVAKREMHNMDSKQPLDVILFSYITHYIETIEDGMYFIDLLEKNKSSSMFVGFAANGLAAAYKNMTKGITASDGLRYVLALLMEEPINDSDYKSPVSPAAKSKVFTSRDEISAIMADYVI